MSHHTWPTINKIISHRISGETIHIGRVSISCKIFNNFTFSIPIVYVHRLSYHNYSVNKRVGTYAYCLEIFN
jgi:hypothetical protein